MRLIPKIPLDSIHFGPITTLSRLSQIEKSIQTNISGMEIDYGVLFVSVYLFPSITSPFLLVFWTSTFTSFLYLIVIYFPFIQQLLWCGRKLQKWKPCLFFSQNIFLLFHWSGKTPTYYFDCQIILLISLFISRNIILFRFQRRS